MRIVEIDRKNPDPAVMDEAARLIREGGVIIVPTDTVYGLAASYECPEAVERIRRIKRRPEGMALAVIAADVEDIAPLVNGLSPEQERILKERFPGPVTFVLTRAEHLPDTVAPGLSTIALRVPDCAISVGIAQRVGPYVATSANVTGDEAPGAFDELAPNILDEVDLALDGGPCPVGRASAVVDLTRPTPVVIIRPGPGWE